MKQFGYDWGKHKFEPKYIQGYGRMSAVEMCINCGENRLVIARNKLKCKGSK